MKNRHFTGGYRAGIIVGFALATLQGFSGEPHSADNSSVVSHSLC